MRPLPRRPAPRPLPASASEPALTGNCPRHCRLNRFFSTVLPLTGPFNPHVFCSMVFLVTVFPTADWVPLTRNSIPAGFDVTVFFVTRLPVAKILMRIPARTAAGHQVVLDGVVGAREHEDADAIPGERVLPDHVIGRHAPDHDPPAPVVPEVVVPDRVAAAAGLKIDAVDVLDEFVPLDHDPGRRVGEHTRREVPDGAPEDGDAGPPGDVDPGAGAGRR